MNVAFSTRCKAALWFCVLAGSSLLPAVSQTPSLNALNFQGRLAAPSGNPITDGTYSIRFSLWDASTGGTEKYNKTIANVQVKNGSFAVTLDTFPAGTFNSNLWLEIKIGNDNALTPRTPLVSVPYALKSDLALTVPDGSITSAKLASGLFNSTAWLLNGNSGVTNGFLGTTGDTPLEFRVNNRRAFRLSFADRPGNMNQAGYRSINVLGGSEFNTVDADVVGATIAGGGKDIYEWQNGHIPNRIHADFGTIGGGADNIVGGGITPFGSGLEATIAGGYGNRAVGARTSIGGGTFNNALSDDTTIAGGGGNTADGYSTTIGGGTNNKALKLGATVSGGQSNIANGNYAVVSGGVLHSITGATSVIGGGWQNSVMGDSSTIAGGFTNSITQSWATIAGGKNNQALGEISFVGGGLENIAGEYANVVAGGYQNSTASQFSTVGGGQRNAANGNYATVAGGYNNTANGDYSFAAGIGAKANHTGTFVWKSYGNGDSVEFASTAPKQFLISAQGGVGINTNNPGTYALSVSGAARFTGSINVGGTTYTSDKRYKTHISELGSPLATLRGLHGVSYQWDKAHFPEMHFQEGRQFGFLAQEVEKIFPELVSTDAEGYKSVNYIGVVPVAVEAIKALKRDADAQQQQIDELKARLARLERLLEGK